MLVKIGQLLVFQKRQEPPFIAQNSPAALRSQPKRASQMTHLRIPGDERKDTRNMGMWSPAIINHCWPPECFASQCHLQRNFSQAWMQWLDIYSVDNLTPTIKLFGTKLKTSSTTRYQYFKLCCGRDPFQTHSMHQNLKRLRPQAIHWSILTCRWWRMQACWFPSFAAGSEDPLLYNQMVARIISAPKCSTL